MHIKESATSMTAAHHLESQTTRQFLLGEPAAGQAKFDDLLEQARQAAQPQALAIILPEAAANNSGEDMLQRILALLLDGDYAAVSRELATAGARSDAPPMLALVHTRETESCSFSASGNICLADGTTCSFDVDYQLERSEESTGLSFGALRDPLVLDFDAPDASLDARSVAFDLDADGTTENMRMPGGNAAYLFHDRNGNGQADDGRELFGPSSGNGFAELAKLDEDGNRWIDAGDSAYADLKLWRLDADGQQKTLSLAEAGIGALSTQYEDTPFTIKENGKTVGQMRGSSVWLGEESGAGIVRQIDVATAPADKAESAKTA